MRVSDRALTVCHHHNVLPDTDIAKWVKCWLHCGGRERALSHCIVSEVACPLFPCYEKVKYEKNLLTVVRRFGGQLLPELGPSLVVLLRLFSHFHFAEPFDYWMHDCNFEFRLRRHAGGVFDGWRDVQMFAIPLYHLSGQYIQTPSWW